MTAKTELSAPERRTRAEVQQLVAEFVSSGMQRSEFCQSLGLSFSTLDRHLKKRRWKRRRRSVSSAGRLVPVELAARKLPTQFHNFLRLFTAV
jgi:DNA-binding transcriptional ArsR family regulator